MLGLVGALFAVWVTDLSSREHSLIWSILVAAGFAAVLVLVKNLITNRRS